MDDVRVEWESCCNPPCGQVQIVGLIVNGFHAERIARNSRTIFRLGDKVYKVNHVHSDYKAQGQAEWEASQRIKPEDKKYIVPVLQYVETGLHPFHFQVTVQPFIEVSDTHPSQAMWDLMTKITERYNIGDMSSYGKGGNWCIKVDPDGNEYPLIFDLGY